MLATISIISKILLVSFASVGLFFTLVNSANANVKGSIPPPPANFFLQTAGIIGTLYMILHVVGW